MGRGLGELLNILPRVITSLAFGAFFLIAATATLRFYDTTDFPPKFLPLTLREWSFWAFLATILVAMVDFGLKWYVATRRRDREIEMAKRQAGQDFALFSYLANPTKSNRQRL